MKKLYLVRVIYSYASGEVYDRDFEDFEEAKKYYDDLDNERYMYKDLRETIILSKKED